MTVRNRLDKLPIGLVQAADQIYALFATCAHAGVRSAKGKSSMVRFNVLPVDAGEASRTTKKTA